MLTKLYSTYICWNKILIKKLRKYKILVQLYSLQPAVCANLSWNDFGLTNCTEDPANLVTTESRMHKESTNLVTVGAGPIFY